MGLIKGVQIHPLESIQGGMAEFYTPQSSDETMVVKIPANTIDDLFVHRNQTDQLLVVKGTIVLVILYNREYQYIPLTAKIPQIVIIPPKILHGSINPTDEDCLLVNALLRHGEPHPKDYQPAKKPFEYDLEKAKLSLKNIEAKASEIAICH
ncbi:MAG: cupin domain-containing protein [Cyanobacteria bacterium P01_F01_bin.143]